MATKPVKPQDHSVKKRKQPSSPPALELVPGGKEIVEPRITPKITGVDLIRIEKNLAELGFFTPTSKRVKTLKSKTITLTRTIDGEQIEGKVTYIPNAILGLPSTADQDKWLAFQKIVNDIQQERGQVSNPITFRSADFLRLLGQVDSGSNFKDIDEWLDRMWGVNVISEGVVFYAGRKIRVKDRTEIKVFARAVTVGRTLDDGTIADKNYVWLSDWQMENINNKHQLPVDFEEYKKLKNAIAKALVPLLQIWLYATRDKGVFEKRYDEICQLLNITRYPNASRITEKLGPSLDELKRHGYLSEWRIAKTSDNAGFKIVFHHGEKFHRARRRQLATTVPTLSVDLTAPPQPVDESLVAELICRGIGAEDARKHLADLPTGFPTLDLLEWADAQIARRPRKFDNPPGFYISVLKKRQQPPANFLTSRKAREIEAVNQAKYQARIERQMAEQAAEEEERRSLNARIAAMTPEVRQELFGEAKKKLLQAHPKWGFEHYLKTNPEALGEEGPVYSRMRQMLKEGWNPSVI